MTYRNTALLMALLFLSACACPRTTLHGDTPYGHERTAGAGAVENDFHCLRSTVGIP